MINNLKKLSIFNTMSHLKEEFVPLMESDLKGIKDFVGVYTCGPTVYRSAHVGNMKSYVFADILKDTLKNILGYKVKYIINITDVGHLVGDGDEGEDKMEKGARREGISCRDVALRYENEFHRFLQALNINGFDKFPRATDHIPEQIDFIKLLEQKGLTYQIDDGIYMDTNKIAKYGKLGNVGIDGIEEEISRVSTNQKKNLTDFALWKFSLQTDAKRQMEWDSPRGIGFPGWHIECSAMSRKYLGDRFDIHTGGKDHIPVHHTNEIAQSENALDVQSWVKYWMHNEFLTINGTKVSKSLGNCYFLDDIIKEGFDPLDLRFYLLLSHYRNPGDFTWANLRVAQKTLNNLISKLGNIFSINKLPGLTFNYENISNYQQFEDKYLENQEVKIFFHKLIDSILDDLNIPNFFAILHKHIGIINELDVIKIIIYFDEKLLKLNLKDKIANYINATEFIIPEEIQKLAQLRYEAKKNKDFTTADKLRVQIRELGYEIEDYQNNFKIKKYVKN